MKTLSHSIGRWVGFLAAGAFVVAVGVPVTHADETVIEKRTQESHSYKVEESAPAVVEHHVVTETETSERPTVVEKHTTVETVPAAPVVQRRTTETVHTED